MRPTALPAAFQCGTRAGYISGCRCLPCRAANSRYESERRLARRNGDWNGLVDAGPVRAHLRALSRAHVGRRAVAAASDVSLTVIADIRSGRKTQIRARTAKRLLAVTVDAVSDRALVPAGPTHVLLNKLLREEGFTKTELARRLGSRAATPSLQILKTTMVTAKTAATVERLYTLLMLEDSCDT